MPKYAYKCDECTQIFEVVHSYKEVQEECILCGKKGSINKVLSTPINVLKSTKALEKTIKAGDAVKSAIEENKQALKKQKDDLDKKR